MAELTQRERGVLEQLELLIRQGKSESDAASTLAVLTNEDDLVERMVRYRHAIAEERRTFAKKEALYDPEDIPPPWYTGPSEYDVFWPALKNHLEADPGWVEAVPSLDETSTDIVGLLADPHSETIRTRGLVLGYVQSGKTANFTATIAKAADAGYRMFIILSGVHNSLRRQTQLRIDEHLVNRQPARWLPLTDEHRDFGNPVKALPLLAQPNLRLIAVVKKNVSRMTRLRNWLREAHKHGGLDTCPVLVIDDEADQASPNAAKNAELDRTRINQRLIELLALPRVAYVGYTATPFANVLINPSDTGDIYPRTFVYSLPKPKTYFGSRELFGKAVSEDEATEDDAPHDMIRIVPEDEAARHSVSSLLSDGPEVTPALADAINWFLLATTARRVRTGVAKHSSMLIHTTMRVDPQLEYLEPIRAYVKRIGTLVDQGDTESLRQLWESEISREPAARHNLRPLLFDELLSALPSVIDEVKVLADNGRSADRLIYGDEPATVIAVGGNTLSRGLTLEGLVSSYFLRSSSQYDSLLQMGRWFGYRPGYGDLPRIWTTQQLADDFEFLADVEDAIRREVERYRTMDGASPANLPVRILLHPRMHATSSSKLQFAVKGDASFSGQRPQTTYFAHRDRDVIDNNISATRRLIAAALNSGIAEEQEESRLVLRGVPATMIREFIREYKFHESSELTSELLINYIDSQLEAGSLHTWNLAVMGRQEPSERLDLGLSEMSPLITRSKLARNSTESLAVIGTLMSKPDRVADLKPASEIKPSTSDRDLQQIRDENSRGLLLLYPIDKDSKPKVEAKHRIPLEAAGHLIGVAFSFPTADPSTEPVDTIQVDPALLPQAADEERSEDDYVDEEGSRDEVDLGDG
ncbi:Z1 domain-containing protein [Mycolicibacterium thermoresistibile]